MLVLQRDVLLVFSVGRIERAAILGEPFFEK
jgi:hypothetical protein